MPLCLQVYVSAQLKTPWGRIPGLSLPCLKGTQWSGFTYCYWVSIHQWSAFSVKVQSSPPLQVLNAVGNWWEEDSRNSKFNSTWLPQCKGAHIKSSPGCAGIVYLQPTHIPLQPPLIFSPYISTPKSQFLQFYSYVLLKVLYILGELSATENSQLLRMLFSTRLMSRWTLCLGV